MRRAVRRLFLVLAGSLGIPALASAACLPLEQGQRVIADLQPGRRAAAKFQGSAARRAIDILVPGGGAQFDILYLIPRPDGSAGIILGSTARREICITQPIASANAAQLVDAIGTMQAAR